MNKIHASFMKIKNTRQMSSKSKCYKSLRYLKAVTNYLSSFPITKLKMFWLLFSALRLSVLGDYEFWGCHPIPDVEQGDLCTADYGICFVCMINR